MSKSSSDSKEFYENLSPVYDRMTRFSQRLDSERAMLAAWRQKYNFATALDAACGTGLHAIALAQLGVKVTATDLSAGMLALARQHASEFKVEIDWLQAPMQELSGRVQGPFDMLFCLGNSLPHLLFADVLVDTLRGFRKLLNPGGHLLLQLVNYDRILKEKQRVIAIHKQDSEEFIRFYDYDPPFVNFNILRIDWSADQPVHRIDTTRLFPYRLSDLERALITARFSHWRVCGDMSARPYDPDTSANLVIVAEC